MSEFENICHETVTIRKGLKQSENKKREIVAIDE